MTLIHAFLSGPLFFTLDIDLPQCRAYYFGGRGTSMQLRTLLLVGMMVVNALACPPTPDSPRLPWLLSPGIVDQLMVHTAVPEEAAKTIFEVVRTTQLEQLERLKDAPIKTALDGGGGTRNEWFSEMVCADRHFEIIKVWNDPGWTSSSEIDWTVKATETVTFYADHWEQVNANGIFFGKIAPQ
jgi:hypothetical protein